MLAYYFTKPLKEKVLKIFRDILMGYKPIFSLKSIRVSIEERVENTRKMLENIFDQKLLKPFPIKKLMWHFLVRKYNPKKKKMKKDLKICFEKIRENLK